MAVDGFVLDVADTPANARTFGRPGGSRAPEAFPQVRLLALCETGSHVRWRWLLMEIAEEVLEPRRNRINPRVIKRKMSRWLKKRSTHRAYPQSSKPFEKAIVICH